MTDRFDSMLRRQFNHPSGSVAAVFTRDGGEGQPIRIRYGNAEGVAQTQGGGGFVSAQPTVEMLQADIPVRPTNKDRLAVEGRAAQQCRNVTSDPHNKLWRMALVNG